MNADKTLWPATARAEASPRPATALTFAMTGLAGASLEMYDFLLYGTAAALVFPVLFFPATLPPLVALLASFSGSHWAMWRFCS